MRLTSCPTAPGKYFVAGDRAYVYHAICQAHQCDTTTLGVLFDPVSKRIVGQLLDACRQHWLGQPDSAEMALLDQRHFASYPPLSPPAEVRNEQGRGDSADKVPPMKGGDIEWVHRDATGRMDVAATRAAARDMMQAYVIRYPAALSSRHTQRRAIDMTITSFKDKTVKDSDGKDVRICSKDDLYALGKTFGVIKLMSAPHTGPTMDTEHLGKP